MVFHIPHSKDVSDGDQPAANGILVFLGTEHNWSPQKAAYSPVSCLAQSDVRITSTTDVRSGRKSEQSDFGETLPACAPLS